MYKLCLVYTPHVDDLVTCFNESKFSKIETMLIRNHWEKHGGYALALFSYYILVCGRRIW